MPPGSDSTTGLEVFGVVLLMFLAAGVAVGLLITILLVALIPAFKASQRRTLTSQDLAQTAGLTYIGNASLRGTAWPGSPAAKSGAFRSCRDVMFGNLGEYTVVHFRMQLRLPAQAFALPLNQWVVTALYIGGTLPASELPAHGRHRVWVADGWLMTLESRGTTTPAVLNEQVAALVAAASDLGDERRAAAEVHFGRGQDPRDTCSQLFPSIKP